MSVGTASLENAMSRPQDAPRAAFVRRHLGWVLFLLMLAVFAAGRLVGPRIPDDQQKYWCAINVRITAQLGVSLNCDSPEFMRVAARPSLLLGTSTPMQSRPGMPIAAWLVALPLQPLASLVPHLVSRPERADIDQARVAGALQSFGPEYVAYILLNLLILCASFHVFRRIYRLHQPVDRPEAVAVVAVSFATLMVATFPVTNYLLTPHSQLFNTLVPLLALFFSIRANEGALADIRFAAVVGAIVGFGQTAYALFLVITMAVLLFAGLHALSDWRNRAKLLLLRNAAVLVAMSLAPVVAWYAFLRFGIGQFHYHEIESDKSVVWMAIALQRGEFVPQLVRRLEYQWYGLRSFLPMIELMALATLGFLVAAAVRLGRHTIVVPLIRETRWTLGIALIVGVMFFGFYVIVGQFQVRLDYAVLPPVISALAAIATSLAGRLPTTWRRSFGGVCAAVALLALALAVAEGRRPWGDWFD